MHRFGGIPKKAGCKFRGRDWSAVQQRMSRHEQNRVVGCECITSTALIRAEIQCPRTTTVDGSPRSMRTGVSRTGSCASNQPERRDAAADSGLLRWRSAESVMD